MSTKKKPEPAPAAPKNPIEVAIGIQIVSARALGNLLTETMDAQMKREKPDLAVVGNIAGALRTTALNVEALSDAARAA